MNPQYVRALHIIFVVTWFSGMFYIVRLFIYNREAQSKAEPEKRILSTQFNLMIKRLWLDITMPSAALTIIFGILMISILMLVEVQHGISLLYGLIGLVVFVMILMSAIKIYKLWREK